MAKFALDDEVRAALAEAIKPIRAQWEAELAVVMAERAGARDQKEEAIRRWQAAERTLAQIGADVEAFPAMRARAESAEREAREWQHAAQTAGACREEERTARLAAEASLAQARALAPEVIEYVLGEYPDDHPACVKARALASALGRGEGERG